MPSQETGKSPGRRLQIVERTSSSQSLSKDGTLSTTKLHPQKGSSTRLHKTHVKGHGHPRVPSHGKGLNKLAKASGLPLTTAAAAGGNEEQGQSTRHHRRSASHTPSTSPKGGTGGGLSAKRNNSALNLSRASFKASVKRNMSHPNLSRNISGIKLGNATKSDKAQLKKNLAKLATDDVPAFGGAHFELGDDAQEDEWTEESTSQSPVTTRTSSRPKTPVTPGPFRPAGLGQGDGAASSSTGYDVWPAISSSSHHKGQFSHPPDAQAVTKRLLSHNVGHNLPPHTSKISANVTPQHIGSPLPTQSQNTSSTHAPESSMPSDGISRFLSGTTVSSGSGTPGSVSHLQQNLAHLERSGSDAVQSRRGSSARRSKSAMNLTHDHLSSDELTPSQKEQDVLRPSSQHSTSKENEKTPWRPSPFESARGADPAAGKSYTLLKLNLDREAVARDPPLSNHPLLMGGGSMLNTAGTISANAADLEQRIKRQYGQARKDILSARRYYTCIIAERIPLKAVRKYQLEKGALGAKEKRGRDKRRGQNAGADVTVPSSPENVKIMPSRGKDGRGEGKSTLASAASKGRVRFEIGGRNEDDSRRKCPEEHAEEDSLDALLRRMWVATEAVEGGSPD